MVFHSGGAFLQFKGALDDLVQHSSNNCMDAVAATSCRSKSIVAAENSNLSFIDPFTSATKHRCKFKSASFLGFPATQQGQLGHDSSSTGSTRGPVVKTSFTDPKCWFKPPLRCRYSDECGITKDCQTCGTTERDCNSDDCALWSGTCRKRDVGEGFKMGEWYYYSGASRPFKETGDTTKFGALVHLIGPGKPKDPATETEAEKSQDIDNNKKSWKLVYFPGNMKYVRVKSLSRDPPQPPEPPSKEARIARAEALYNMKSMGIMGGMLSPCDPKGRILSAGDGTFCEDDQVCVTALPADFSKYTGKFCWHWFVPDCPEVKCPDKPYCPPPRKCSLEGKCPPEHTCPEAPPCPKREKECEPGFWKDMCKKNAGQPWCVPPDVLKRYRRPIEIKCSSSGREVREKEGSPDGCWWLMKYSKHDLQRLPGKIKRNYADAGGWFVTGVHPEDKDAIEEKSAEKWITTGEFSGMKVENSEFLKKKQPPPSTAQTA